MQHTRASNHSEIETSFEPISGLRGGINAGFSVTREILDLSKEKTTSISKRSAKFRLAKRATESKKTHGKRFTKRKTTKEITSFACEILETTYALKEFSSLYKDSQLMGRFIEGQNINDPRFTKMQKRFNSLRDRATRLGSADSRVSALFNKMVHVGIHSQSKTGGLDSVKKDVIDLIGKENIIDAGNFKKFGIICVKDAALPNPCPENVVTETELQEMHELRASLFNPKTKAVKIQGSLGFEIKTKKNFEKLLTFKEGRALIGRLCEAKKNLLIKEGKKDCFKYEMNKVTLTHKKHTLVGYDDGVNISIRHATWLTLAHELVHVLHHFDEELKDNRSQEIDDKKLWGNGEERETIGDPRKEIKPLSENGFRRHTLHPLRIHHTGGISRHLDLDSRVDHCSEKHIDGDLIEILENSILSKLQIKKIVVSCLRHWSVKLADALLNHPLGKEVIGEENYIFSALSGAAEGDDLETIKKMQKLYPTLQTLDEIDRNNIFLAAVISSVKVTDYYISLGFDAITTKNEILRQFYTFSDFEDIKCLQVLNHYKNKFEITEEDLAPILAKEYENPEVERILRS